MDHQKLFQTVGGHRTKAPMNLHYHQHHHHSNSTSTRPITPPSATSSSSIPHGLSTTNNWHQASTAATPSAPPSSSATGSVSCSSTPTTHTTDHHFSHSTLSSPVNFDSNVSHSSISHHDSNGILGAASFTVNGIHNGYIPISNHNRNQNLNYNNFLLQTLSSTSSSTTRQYATAVTNSNPDNSNFAAAVNNTDITMHPPTGIVIRDGDMDNASYYCFDRGNGQFTPLIPLDQLPADILGLPARVASDENMIVLPEPRLAGDAANNQALAKFAELSVTPPTSPHNGGGSTDLIQSRIDDIVAQNPNRQNALVLARNPKNHAGGSGIIINNNNNSHNALIPTGGKREKIYCDKWIHDGTCAFTQQGCKFKHEMPGDRETQQSLGLFHGYPAWWKKKCAEENMPIDMIDRPVHVSGGGHRNIVGRLTGVTPTHTAGGGHNNVESIASSALASNNWRQRTALGSPHSPPGDLATPNVTTPLSAGSNGSSGNGSSGASRTPWQPRGRAVGGNIQSRSTVARYNMPHFAQPNFGPIAPPSQTATGFNNNNTPSRGSAHRSTNAINNTSGADNSAAVAPPVEQQQHDTPGLPRGLRRTGGIPLRGGAQADESGTASSEDSSTNQSTDEMGNASGVKL